MKTQEAMQAQLMILTHAATALLAFALQAQEYTFTTLAGPMNSLSLGAIDGTGSAALFRFPASIAVDNAGNLYVADGYPNGSHTIRKITPTGVVTTLAGLAYNSGASDGTGSSARFNGPTGVAVDSGGSVYVADTYNHTIRKITPEGVVTTLAGRAGSPGFVNGTGSAARFNYPDSVAVDSAGNVYVAESNNGAIRKVTPGGLVTTLALESNFPSGVAVDSAGNVYVGVEEAIRKITPGGVVTTLAGVLGGACTSADGTGTAAGFCGPHGLAVDSQGNIFVADRGNQTIRQVAPDGTVTTLAGQAGISGSTDGIGSDARFAYPSGVAVDGTGNVYVADAYNHTVRRVAADGTVTTLAGVAAGFNVGDVDASGTAARFDHPTDVAVDSAGNVYVPEGGATIREATPGGAVTTLAGTFGQSGTVDGMGGAARFQDPWGIAVDPDGNVYVAEYVGGDTIRKVTPAGEVTTLAGLAGMQGSDDGTGSDARFLQPEGVAADSAGAVYVADTGNNTIRKITPDGTVTTLAGLAGSPGSADGSGSGARFNFPTGVTVDSATNVFVADQQNYTIRKVAPDGTVTTIAGSPGHSGTNDGPGSAARFLGPHRVAADQAGNLFVLDNGSIRKVTPSGMVSTVDISFMDGGSLDGSGIAVDSTGNLYVTAYWNGIWVGTTNTCPDRAIIDLAAAPVGQSRQLDTSPQTAIAWQWGLIRQPSASSARLSDGSVRNPTFTPDVPDLYIFRLFATNAAGAVCIRTVSLTATAQPPRLSISSAGANVILAWPTNVTGFTLQSAPAVTGTFTNIPGATSPFTNPFTGPQQFFRLISN